MKFQNYLKLVRPGSKTSQTLRCSSHIPRTLQYLRPFEIKIISLKEETLNLKPTLWEYLCQVLMSSSVWEQTITSSWGAIWGSGWDGTWLTICPAETVPCPCQIHHTSLSSSPALSPSQRLCHKSSHCHNHCCYICTEPLLHIYQAFENYVLSVIKDLFPNFTLVVIHQDTLNTKLH